MWCASCKADVAAEVTAETGRVRCAQCGTELAQAHAIRERTKDAREILQRWSNKSLLDPYGPLPGSRSRQTAPQPTAQPTANTAPPADHESQSTTARPTQPANTQEPEPVERQSPLNVQVKAKTRSIRIDAAEPVENITATRSHRTRSQRRPAQRFIDGSHGHQLAGPHFEMAPVKRSNWTITAGQWLAYIGVLALTIGTAVVVYGHFGGYSNYTPTGWLITTVGQMLLFLGVINLVSGGMEQSNDEVSQRIEILGEQLLRIESRAESLRGPKIDPRAYADGPDAVVNPQQHDSLVE